MKKVTIKKTEIVQAIILTQAEKQIIKQCLDYGWHRIKKHTGTGMERLRGRLSEIDVLRKQF